MVYLGVYIRVILGFWDLGFTVILGDHPPIMQNQMEENMEMKWKLGLYRGYSYKLNS